MICGGSSKKKKKILIEEKENLKKKASELISTVEKEDFLKSIELNKEIKK